MKLEIRQEVLKSSLNIKMLKNANERLVDKNRDYWILIL
jgi:hypothetical protein